MTTLAECITQLKTDLAEISPQTTLSENYDAWLNNDDEAQFAGSATQIVKIEPFPSFEKLNQELLKSYSTHSLQAIWNVAEILDKIKSEHSYSIVLIPVITAELLVKENNKTRLENLQNCFNYMDSDNCVPHIIGHETYQINTAIAEFIDAMQQTPSGKILYDQPLGKLSFTAMQTVAKERIKNYEMYLDSQSPSNSEPITDHEISSQDSEDEEYEYVDAIDHTHIRPAKLLIPEVEEEQFSDVVDSEDEEYVDAIDDTHIRPAKLLIPEVEGKKYCSDDEEEQFSDVVDSEDKLNRVRKIDQLKLELLNSFHQFSDAVLPKLQLRLLKNTDTEQTNRCQNAINMIEEMHVKLSEAQNMTSMNEYLSTNMQKMDEIFSENRSQTWFRKYVAEPYESFKAMVNAIFKDLGLKEPLSKALTNTSKEFKRFREKHHGIFDHKETSSIEHDLPIHETPGYSH